MFGCLENTAIKASYHTGHAFVLPETGNQYLCAYTDIIKSQYHGDVVVSVLRTVTLKGKYGSYISKNFERSPYIALNKKIFGTISMNTGDEAGD